MKFLSRIVVALGLETMLIRQDPIHLELKVRGLTRFIPFRPSHSQPILNQ